MEWLLAKDKPEKSCQILVTHVRYFPYSAFIAFYNHEEKCFTWPPHDYRMPPTLPIEVTHYIIIPEPPVN